MNHGKFFSLDLAASRIEEGIAVFNYTDIFDAEVTENHTQTPRYPICVSITSTSVKFILQYCVYLHNNDFVPSIKNLIQQDEYKIRHMEEVLIELPLKSTSGLSLTSILKRLYISPFPIDIQGEKNYILELISNRYEFGTAIHHHLKREYDGIDVNIHYSSLPVWNLYNDDFGYILFDSRYKYNKVLRKLILDFFFDMMHSDVFKNSVHYDEMYSKFMADFFCSAIIRKSEFYYQRALVNDWIKDNHSISDSVGIYAENLERAEKHWVECIQSPDADKHFEFQPNWFEPEVEQTGWWFKKIEWLKNNLCPIFQFTIVKFWFAPPEEELRRVYYHDRGNNISCSKDLCCEMNKQRNVYKSQNIIQERSNTSSKWFLKRYNFRDAYRVSWFNGTNSLVLFSLLAIITCIFAGWWIVLEVLSILLLISAICLRLYFFLCKSKKVDVNKIIFLYPRLIASITAAWFTITLGEDLFKAFFDAKVNWVTWGAIVLFIWGFVIYEVHRIVPKIGFIRKMGRALELMVISFAISLVVGICVINFTGDRMLVRSGILPKAFRDDVLVHTGDNPNGDPNLMLNFSKIAADSAIWNDSIVMNVYTHAPNTDLDSIGSSLAVQKFANASYNNMYMTNLVETYDSLDSLLAANIPNAPSDSLVRGRFLLRHDNSLLFKDLLPYVEHRDNNRPVAKIIPLGRNYKLFLLHDFLIQFAVIAMFIGIFIQMIFEEKNVTES